MKKQKSKTTVSSSSIRIKSEIKKTAKAFLNKVNSENKGCRKMKIDDIFELALSLVTDDHLKGLRQKAMTNKGRMEILRQKYIELNGYISEDDFLGLAWSPQLQEFVKQQEAELFAA
ncbi:MAG: hypothetical protein KF681_00115 [Bdellovibrionaceae bacterium]|nr:hypothetical protein [Pseudobdellovibrionaceae bacterium]